MLNSLIINAPIKYPTEGDGRRVSKLIAIDRNTNKRQYKFPVDSFGELNLVPALSSAQLSPEVIADYRGEYSQTGRAARRRVCAIRAR